MNLFALYMALAGVCFGSFLNVLIYRLPRQKKPNGRSKCPNCDYVLSWYDLIPLVSYAILRGKCRKCGEKITIRYPLVEMLCGVMFYLIACKYGLTLSAAVMFLIMLLVLLGVFTDFEFHGILNICTFGLIPLVILFHLFNGFQKELMPDICAGFIFYPMLLVVFAIPVRIRMKNRVLGLLSLIPSMVFITLGMLWLKITVDMRMIKVYLAWMAATVCLNIITWSFKQIKKVEMRKLQNIIHYLEFVTLLCMPFLINGNYDMGRITITLIVSTMMFLYLIEIGNGHDNNEDIIENDVEMVEREENKWFTFLGDADLLALFAIGGLLGAAQAMNFIIIASIVPMGIYVVIFGKRENYTLPMYPFIAYSMLYILFLR